MKDTEKIAMLEDLFEIDEGTLEATTDLDDIEEYDSMAKLAMIVMFQDEFNVNLSSEDVKSFKTVGDIIAKMEK